MHGQSSQDGSAMYIYIHVYSEQALRNYYI